MSGAWRLVLIGALPRLACAGGVAALLWLGYFWATGRLG